MAYENHRERLRDRTAETAVLLRHAARRLEARRSESLRPGDLVLSTRTEHLPIEWLVLEKTGIDPAELVVVPVDTMGLYGAFDARLSRAETGGPVIARCGFSAQVAADVLSSRNRTGRVDSEALALAQERYRESDGLSAQAQVDDPSNQPDYQDWIEDVVEPARECLRGELPAVAPPSAGTAREPARERSITRPRDLLLLYKIAASALLALGMALAAGWFTEHRELNRLTRRWEDSRARHVAVAFLAAQDNLRGKAESLELPEDAERFVLVIFLDPTRLYDRYRVEITPDNSGDPIWYSGDLARGKDAHLGLELQRLTLPNGSYTARLYGLAEGTEPAGELKFEITNE